MCSEPALSVCGARMSFQFPRRKVKVDQLSAVNSQSFLVDQRSFSTEVVSWRCLVLWFAGKRSFRSLLAKRTVVIGSTTFLREMSGHFAKQPDTGFELVGTFDSSGEVDRASETPFIGGMSNLRQWCIRHRIRTVLIE